MAIIKWYESIDTWKTFYKGAFHNIILDLKNIVITLNRTAKALIRRCCRDKNLSDLFSAEEARINLELIDDCSEEGGRLGRSPHHHDARYLPLINSSVFIKGMIMMWYGSISTIPNGWVICNGSNGTPDLRDKFIVGAGSSYSLGSTGGKDKVTLTKDQMPAHGHTRGTMNITGAHGAWNFNVTQGAFYARHDLSENIKSGGHSSEGVGFDASRSWTGETSKEGKDQAHENRPPYYALYYIMNIGKEYHTGPGNTIVFR